MDKAHLVEQLTQRVQQMAATATRAAAEAQDEARSGAQRAVNLSRAHTQRALSVVEASHALSSFKPGPWPRGQPVGLGALVEVESELGGKTLFVAPVCGGEELEGPGGDGLFHVVTPTSPLGRAVVGKKVGHVAEVTAAGELTEWTITWVG